MEGALCAVLLGMVLCSLAVALLPRQLAFIATHGKSAKKRGDAQIGKAARSSIDSILATVSAWTVSKSLFRCMYAFGIVVTLYHMVSLSLPLLSSPSPSSSPSSSMFGHGDARWMNCMFSLLLLEFHLVRRLWECYYCTIYSDSVMHVSGLLCGLLHYLLVPLCIIQGTMSESNRLYHSSTWKVASIGLFVASNYYQYQYHRILFKMKLKFADSYALPTEALFRHVCCPHYLMEILIYFSFLLQSPCSMSLIFLQIWVTANLCVVAHQNLMFYREKFKDVKGLKRWKRIVPYVW